MRYPSENRARPVQARRRSDHRESPAAPPVSGPTYIAPTGYRIVTGQVPAKHRMRHRDHAAVPSNRPLGRKPAKVAQPPLQHRTAPPESPHRSIAHCASASTTDPAVPPAETWKRPTSSSGRACHRNDRTASTNSSHRIRGAPALRSATGTHRTAAGSPRHSTLRTVRALDQHRCQHRHCAPMPAAKPVANPPAARPRLR